MPAPGNLTQKTLASELGTTARSIRDWQEKYADAPHDNDPEKWRAFMRERGLACYSGRRNAPMLHAPAPPASLPKTSGLRTRSLDELISNLDMAKARLSWRLDTFPTDAQASAQAEIKKITAAVGALYDLAEIPLPPVDTRALAIC